MKKYFACLPKYLIRLSIALLMIISLKIYAPAVQVSKGESEKKYKRALELIDIIGKDAMMGAFSGQFIVKDSDIQELKSLLPYLGSSKQYENLKKALQAMPAQTTPKNDQEKQAMEKYKKANLKPEDVGGVPATPAVTPAPAGATKVTTTQTPAPAGTIQAPMTTQTPAPVPAPAPTTTTVPAPVTTQTPAQVTPTVIPVPTPIPVTPTPAQVTTTPAPVTPVQTTPATVTTQTPAPAPTPTTTLAPAPVTTQTQTSVPEPIPELSTTPVKSPVVKTIETAK